MKFLLTKRLYYHLTKIFNRYYQKFQYTNEKNNYSLFPSNDKRLINMLFYEKNSSRYYYNPSDKNPKNKRFVNCHVCMNHFCVY
jgi:hypothetical protein